MIVFRTAGWKKNTRYRFRVTTGLKDDFGRSLHLPDDVAIELQIPLDVTDTAPVYIRTFKLGYDTAKAAANELGGAFTGGISLGFTGAVADPFSGLLYLRNRWYDPASGTWLSQDPLEDRDSPNLYGFVGARPHEKTDPLGLESLGEIVHGYSGEAFTKGGFWSRLGAIGAEGAYAVIEFASAGAVGKIDKAQEDLDRGVITQGQYLKRAGVAVGQTVASYGVGGAAGRAGAQLARGLSSRIAQGAVAGAVGGVVAQAAGDVVGVAADTQDGLSSWHSYASAAAFGGAFGAASGFKSATDLEVGKHGEKVAAKMLERRGYTEIESIQNESGHGIDIAAKNPQGARRFAEVKTSRGPRAGRLSPAQAKGADQFVTSRLQRAAGGARGWQNVDPNVTARARSLLGEVRATGEAKGFGIDVTNAGHWNETITVWPW